MRRGREERKGTITVGGEIKILRHVVHDREEGLANTELEDYTHTHTARLISPPCACPTVTASR